MAIIIPEQSIDVTEAAQKYADMLAKYVDRESRPEIPPHALDKDNYKYFHDKVLVYIVPNAKMCELEFTGKTVDGITLKFSEPMELASSERCGFLEHMIKNTLAKRRKADGPAIIT